MYTLWAYEWKSNTYQLIKDNVAIGSINMSGVIEPNRRLFVLAGGHLEATPGSPPAGLIVFDIHDIEAEPDAIMRQDWTNLMTGCEAITNATAPGMAYDADLDAIVAWPSFGDSVYLLDLVNKVCIERSYPKGPPVANGTYGRFRYFPGLHTFAAVSQAEDDAFTLRLED
jgi:hypothetical protein